MLPSMGPIRRHTLEVATRAPDQLGTALARFRVRAEQSQTAVAASAGLRQATVSKAEAGTATVQLRTVYALCAALGLELVIRPRRSATATPPTLI